MQRFLGFFLVVFLVLTTNAKADLLVEPVLGYSAGLKGQFHEANVPGVGTVQKNSFSGGSGGSFGGRLGYQKLGFQVGLDYLHSSINPDDKAMKGNLSIDEWAGFVGFEFPVLFRVYGGYIFSATADGKYKAQNTSEKLTMSDGSGFKAGLGFTLLPFLDINFEYRHGTFSKWKAGALKVDGDVDYNIYMIALSLPIQI
jgi:hypothetical protein